MNNLDPEVAERPEELVVYGGTGKAARNHEALAVIVRELKALQNDETLLIQSGKAVGVVKTHADAPRVLLANSNLVPAWASWKHFRDLEAAGLTAQLPGGDSRGIGSGDWLGTTQRWFDNQLNNLQILLPRLFHHLNLFISINERYGRSLPLQP